MPILDDNSYHYQMRMIIIRILVISNTVITNTVKANIVISNTVSVIWLPEYDKFLTGLF